jgi:hypothetical protein
MKMSLARQVWDIFHSDLTGKLRQSGVTMYGDRIENYILKMKRKSKGKYQVHVVEWMSN